MGRRTTEKVPKSHTLPSSPTHSSSSSDFEFTISLSPRKSTAAAADDLFYKGQLLPLHLSPRLSMVRHLLLSSSSTSSSSTTTTNATTSRDSSGSSTDSHSSFTSDLLLADCDSSSRPSSAAEDDEFKRLNHNHQQIKKPKYFSFSRISSVFRKEPKTTTRDPDSLPGSSAKRVSSTAKDVIRKYLKKVKPLYEKLSQTQTQTQKQNQKIVTTTTTANHNHHHPTNIPFFTDRSVKYRDTNIQIPIKDINGGHSHSFSGNLRYPRRRSCVSSCPSSMRSSPSHSGVLSRNGFSGTGRGGGACYSDASSMEELQSAIQGAIAHCKNSMIQHKTMSSNEI